MHLENPEALGNPAAGSEEANKRAAEANQRGGELLRDSLFGQSQQKKGEGRRRDLESINEDGESKHYEEDFESVKQDDNMFSLSNSYPAKEPYAKPGNQSSRGKFAQQIHRIEEGGPPSPRLLPCRLRVQSRKRQKQETRRQRVFSKARSAQPQNRAAQARRSQLRLHELQENLARGHFEGAPEQLLAGRRQANRETEDLDEPGRREGEHDRRDDQLSLAIFGPQEER